MSQDTLMLIDLPAVAHPLYHANGTETAPENIAKQIAVKVRQLAEHYPHAAVCCDSGRSFRRELDPTYKAQRDTEHKAAIGHILDLACIALKADGFPVWAVEGFEGDDIIASATAKALACDGRVLIASSDKDLLTLTSDRVTVQSLRDDKGQLTTNGRQMTPESVREKFGVGPEQMVDWLTLVGDASDNIKGADGIGPKRATELLKLHGSVDALYAKMAETAFVPGVSVNMRTSLMEFRDRVRIDETDLATPVPVPCGLAHVRKLITLRTDVPLPFEEIAAERTKPNMDTVAQQGERASAEAAPMDAKPAHAGEVAGSIPAGVPPTQRIWTPPTAADDARIQKAFDGDRPPKHASVHGALARRIAEPEISDEQIALIKRTVAAGATDDELKLFLYDCKRRGVHPLDRLLHFTKRNGKYTPITSIDFLRTRAHETGKCAGITDPAFAGDPKKAGFAATVIVRRLVDGVMAEFGATARWEEYKPQSNDFMWLRMPFTMLGKCAEALALRKAFPQELGGLYTGDEMAQAGIFTQEMED